MLVVADASPLIALGDAGRLELLRALYAEIVVPPQVAREAFEAVPTTRPAWISVRSPTSIPPRVASAGLQAGETEALALALELGADLLLIDDLEARAVARSLGVPITGTVGALVKAKRRGAIPAVRPILDSLIAGGFRLSPDVRAAALRAANE